jgi:uncharacterized protein (DUF427 family)
VRIPGIDHPITIERSSSPVTVRAGGRVIASSAAALVLREAKLAPVFYIPLADVDQSVLARSQHHTYCPYKGKASYYDVVVDGRTINDAIWTYEEPYEAVAEIEGHVAFYPSLVEITTAA